MCLFIYMSLIRFFITYFNFNTRVTSLQMRVHLNTKQYHLTRLRTLECTANSKLFLTHICILELMTWLKYWKFTINLFLYFRYYALEVSYFKSSLDRKLLELLWNKYWVNTLSSSSLLTVSTVFYWRDSIVFHIAICAEIFSNFRFI